MSVHFDTNNSDLLLATTNLPTSTVNFSACWWQKFTTAGAGTVRPLWFMTNAGPVNGYHYVWSNADNLEVGQDSGSTANFAASGTPTPGNPTLTNWVFCGITSTTAGANSLNSYFRDNASGSLTALAMTGIASFTPTQEVIGQVCSASAVPAADFYNYIIFDGVLTPTQMLAQSNQFAPISGGGLTLRRWIKMLAAASAGTDSSGNGFNMTISGTLTDGASNPTFPGAAVATIAEYYYRMLE